MSDLLMWGIRGFVVLAIFWLLMSQWVGRNRHGEE